MKSNEIKEIKIESLPELKGDEYRGHRFFKSEDASKGVRISAIFFPPGVSRPWNVHDRDQYIWVVSGKGNIDTENKKNIVEPGMAILIPAGVKHRHGALKGTHFTQINIFKSR